MMLVVKKSCLFAFAAVLLQCAYSFSAWSASCTPGIPCTGYDIATDKTAGTDAALNGWKTGEKPPFTDSTCDGNYMNQMYSEAFMHATREVAMNAQLIRKSDSILEYTCFDQFIGLSAAYAGAIFSENDGWDNRRVDFKTADDSDFGYYTVNFANNHLDNVMAGLLLNSLKEYITKNFNHTYLGGSSGIDHNLNFTTLGSSYNCGHMEAVWDLSRCTNFGEDDNFVSFGQLVNGDPRQLVSACNGKPAPALNDGAPPDPTGLIATSISALDALGVMTMTETDPCPSAGTTGLITKDQIRLSNNCEQKFSSRDLAKAYFEYFRDPVTLMPLSYLTLPAMAWSGLPCGPPIETGITVPTYIVATIPDPLEPDLEVGSSPYLYEGKIIPGMEYKEHLCINPSCSYVIGTGQCSPSLNQFP